MREMTAAIVSAIIASQDFWSIETAVDRALLTFFIFGICYLVEYGFPVKKRAIGRPPVWLRVKRSFKAIHMWIVDNTIRKITLKTTYYYISMGNAYLQGQEKENENNSNY